MKRIIPLIFAIVLCGNASANGRPNVVILYADDWRTELFYEHPTLRDKDFIPASEALVRKDWKYFFWPESGVEQLFHIIADPFEENELTADPAQKGRLAEMRIRFNEIKAQAK